MPILPILLAASFTVALILTPLLRSLATRIGLVDRPDTRRKIHLRIIPVAGGLAIFLSGTIVLAVAWIVPGSFRDLSANEGPRLLLLLVGCSIICAVGLLDDIITLRGRHKLFAQLLAIVVVMSPNFVVRNIRVFGWDVELGLLSVPFTAFWLLAWTNALNLLDGMDGLLGTVTVIIAGTLGGIAVLEDQWVTASIAFVLMGTTLAYLVYNFPPASIFLGDCGSLSIGLLVGVLSIQATAGNQPTTWAPASALALLTIPMCDTLAAILRRKLTGRSVFNSDRGHLHHCLQRWGFSPRGVLGVVASLCLVSAGGALASLYWKIELVAVLTPLVLVAFLIKAGLFGHAEFVLVKKQIRAVIIRLFLRNLKGKVQQMQVRLQGSIEWEDLWARLVWFASELELVSISLDVNAPAIHEGYYAHWEVFGRSSEEGSEWHAEIPLEAWGPVVGRVVLRGHRQGDEFWNKIGTVVRSIDEFQTTGLPAVPGHRTTVHLTVHSKGQGQLTALPKE